MTQHRLSLRGAERRSNLGDRRFRSSACGSEEGYAITTFSKTVALVAGLLCLEKRVSYRRLRKEFGLDDETLEDVRHELIVKRLAVDEGGQGLAFVGAALFETGNAPPPALHRRAITLPPARRACRAGRGRRGAGGRAPPADRDVLRPGGIDGTLHRDGPRRSARCDRVVSEPVQCRDPALRRLCREVHGRRHPGLFRLPARP